MTTQVSPRSKRLRVRKWQISSLMVFINSLALWLKGQPAQAALYDKFTKWVQTQATTALNGAGAPGSVTTAVTGFIGIIPWGIILIAGATCAWQAYSGYQAYEREDLSGVGKCVLNIVVLIILLFVTSFATDSFVG